LAERLKVYSQRATEVALLARARREARTASDFAAEAADLDEAARIVAGKETRSDRQARCDCQNPDGPDGVRHCSMECPVHNDLSADMEPVPLHGRVIEAGPVEVDGEWRAVAFVRGDFTEESARRVAQAMALAAEDADA
jgi:hypothetical protein